MPQKKDVERTKRRIELELIWLVLALVSDLGDALGAFFAGSFVDLTGLLAGF